MISQSEQKQYQNERDKKNLGIDHLDFQEKTVKPYLGLFALKLDINNNDIIGFQYIIIDQQRGKIQKVIAFDHKLQKHVSLISFLKNSLDSIIYYLRTYLKCVPIPIFIDTITISIFLSFFKKNLKPYKILIKQCIQIDRFFPNSYFKKVSKLELLPLIHQEDINKINEEFIFYLKMILFMSQENIFLDQKHRETGSDEYNKILIEIFNKMKTEDFKKLRDIYISKENNLKNNQNSQSQLLNSQSNGVSKTTSPSKIEYVEQGHQQEVRRRNEQLLKMNEEEMKCSDELRESQIGKWRNEGIEIPNGSDRLYILMEKSDPSRKDEIKQFCEKQRQEKLKFEQQQKQSLLEFLLTIKK